MKSPENKNPTSLIPQEFLNKNSDPRFMSEEVAPALKAPEFNSVESPNVPEAVAHIAVSEVVHNPQTIAVSHEPSFDELIQGSNPVDRTKRV